MRERVALVFISVSIAATLALGGAIAYEFAHPGHAAALQPATTPVQPATGAVKGQTHSSGGPTAVSVVPNSGLSGRVSIAGGQIVIRGIDVYVTVSNNGKPTGKVSVEVGGASIGGVPVTIDRHGVRVKGQGKDLPYAAADKALNSALQRAGLQLHTLEPEITKQPNEQTITATGVHVGFVQPVDAPGVPSQYVDHILGEVFVDSLATPAGPAPKLNLAGGGGGGTVVGGSTGGGGSAGFSSGGGSSYSSSGGLSSSSQPASSGTTGQTSSSLLGSLAHKPTWLLAAYLVWQTLVIGTAVSLRQWRLGGVS
jgi:uncharacterized membrane protein YgcG